MIYEFDEVEQKKLNEFYDKHHDCTYKCLHKPFFSSIGGQYTFTFTPTGIGTIVKVKCNACNKEEDITNNNF